MKIFKIGLTLAVALLALQEHAVQAASPATTQFQVTATVNDSCSVVATDLAFGVYDPSAADNDKTSTVTVTCTKTTPYDIGLNAGVNGGGTVTTRQMLDAVSSDKINYSLFSNAGRTVNWGETVSTDTVHVASATGASEPHTVYGKIATGQYVTAGSYSDTITVTVTY